MIALNIDNDKIEGLEKLYSIFPRNYSFDGVSFKGILLHDNGDIWLTYTIGVEERTYTFVFILSECEQNYRLSLTASTLKTEGIDISYDNEVLHFLEQTNGIDIKCRRIALEIDETLSREFGKEQARILTERYSKELQKKFDVLDDLKLDNGDPLFRRDDSYNDIVSTNNTMYKLADLTNNDGSLEYEFLIEMDRNNPCLGIYYGCKGLIKKGNNSAQKDLLQNEWEASIKPGVIQRLNEVFPEKNFTNRFKPTDNADNNTFWPFWITLHEDEIMEEVAVRALVIIRDEYKRYLEGENYKKDATCRFVIKNAKMGANEAHSVSQFTEESWEDLRCNTWTDRKQIFNAEWTALFDKFIEGALREGVIREYTEKYEKAYQIVCMQTRFCIFMQLLVYRIKLGNFEAPWKKIARNFVTNKGKPCSANSMKNLANDYWENMEKSYKKYNKRWTDKTKKEFENEPYPDKNVIVFKKIMDK